MRKIHLKLDELRVASFSTTDETEPGRGTVHGRDSADTFRLPCSGNVTCASACSWTDGYAACKTAGPCCETMDIC